MEDKKLLYHFYYEEELSVKRLCRDLIRNQIYLSKRLREEFL